MFGRAETIAISPSFFSSPEPLAHDELLESLDVCHPSWVMCCQQLLQRTSPPKLLAGF